MQITFEMFLMNPLEENLRESLISICIEVDYALVKDVLVFYAWIF